MKKLLAEEHPELVHYTNATGLMGIVQSQNLWATHYAHLNDAEEIRHFLVRRLPGILRSDIVEYMKEDQELHSIINREGGVDQSVKKFLDPIISKLLSEQSGEEPLAEPYIASFCALSKNDQVNKHGLLSQWRGYGRDGGYAIVFNTASLGKLLNESGKRWKNGGNLFGGDVIYSSDSDEKFSDEFKENLDVIIGFFQDVLKNNRDSKHVEKIYMALMDCACRYKHWGFKEENEVRFIAMPNNKEVCSFARSDGSIVVEMQRKHFLRSGTIVPFIDLFEHITSTVEKPLPNQLGLPIKRVIIGPSVNDQEMRKKIRAVEILFDQNAMKADVSISEIPYRDNK